MKTTLQKVNQDEKSQGYVMSQIKAQDKAPEKQLNEAEIVNLPVKEFRIIMVKIMIVKIIGSQK